MLTAIENLLSRILKARGMSVVKSERLETLLRCESDMMRIASISDLARHQLIHALPDSRAQLKQDIFALCQSDFRENGFFVEFGATDGISFSNTFLLEKKYGWNGILAEPGRCWHDALKANRRCVIDTSCVWASTGARLVFDQIVEAPELSTISQFKHADVHSDSRSRGAHTYEVATISLVDLLAKHEAPRTIDYLSIDTEGSELSILGSFDFNAYDVRIITVEHNFTPMRERIRGLLESHGYERMFTGISKWDDWYVKAA